MALDKPKRSQMGESLLLTPSSDMNTSLIFEKVPVLKTLEDFNQLETDLNNHTFRANYIRLLASQGGRNHSECIRNILVRSLDGRFASKCNFSGQHDNISLKGSQLFSAIIESRDMSEPKRTNFYRGGFRGRGSFRSTWRRGSQTYRRGSSNQNQSSSETGSSHSEVQSDTISLDTFDSGFISAKAQPLANVDKSCPYPGWLLYFPTRNYDQSAKPAVYTKIFTDFLKDTLHSLGYNVPVSTDSIEEHNQGISFDWIKLETQGAIQIDYGTLLNSSMLKDKLELVKIWGDDVEGGSLCAEQCDVALQSIGLALHTLCYKGLYGKTPRHEFFEAKQDPNTADPAHLPGYIAGRIVNHNPTTALRKLRAHHLGRFVSVKGIVIRVGPVTPICHRMTFECARCEAKQILILSPDCRYAIPNRCPTRDCRSRSFEPLLNHSDTVSIDTQIITVQEACEHESDKVLRESGPNASSVGRNSRCLTCRLSRDLVDSCLPGDVVHLTGMVGLVSSNPGLQPGATNSSSHYYSHSAGRAAPMFNLLLDVNNVTHLSGGGASTNRLIHANQGLLLISKNEDANPNGPASMDSDLGKIISSLDNDFSINDLYAIREISEQPNLFRLLVASLCPSICGRGLIKAGLLLALFGGAQHDAKQQHRTLKRKSRSRPEGSAGPKAKRQAKHELKPEQQSQSPDLSDSEDFDLGISYRLGFVEDKKPQKEQFDARSLEDSIGEDSTADLSACNSDEDNDEVNVLTEPVGDLGIRRRAASHVLIVGDPGLGKSQMLRAAASLAPRVIYVCGNTATAAGLTVSTIREGHDSGGGFGLEAGALVLADQGCCCIDEFDKLSCDTAVLLEAMEQQTISVARGGLVANLPARAAVLAAANPIGGHYDVSRRLDENLRIPPALLSRFDLIFVLLDRPDVVADRLLSEHVTAVHTGNWKPSRFVCTQSSQSRLNGQSHPNDFDEASQLVNELDPSLPLSQRLELRVGEKLDFIPPVLLRKYILYARKYVMPCLSTEAATTLRDFYLELRKYRHSRDTFPVTLRQLESLIRLTEARARAELREEATKQDALDVCELMRSTGLGTGHVGGTPANQTLSQIASLLPPPSRRPTSSTGPAAAKRFLAALELTAERQNSRLFTLSELETLGSSLGFAKAALTTILARLNEAGAVVVRDRNLYKLV